MNLRWSERIGVRLGVAVAAVLVLLVLMMNGLANVAFERSARSVETASSEALERLTHDSLQQVTEREALLIGHGLERFAAATRTAAEYLAWQLDNPIESLPASTLALSSSGHWLDPNPARRSMLHVPRDHAMRASVLHDVRASAVADDLFPGLLAELEDAVAIYFVTPDGLIRYHPPIDFDLLVDPDFDVTVQPVYRLGTPAANPDRQTRWTAPYLDDAGNGLLVTAVTPVYTNGTFRGVLDIDVSLKRIASRLSDLVPLPGSFSIMLDGRGHLIASSSDALRHLGYVCDLSFGPCFDTPELEPLLERVRDRSAGLLTLPERSDPLVLASAPVPDTGWTLSIAVPASALDDAARQISAGIDAEASLARRGIALATLVAFALALAVLMITTRRWVMRPIASLVAGTRTLAAGDLGVALPPTQPGEFRLLGEAFDQMSHTLARQRGEILAHQDDLERRITTRTRQLANLLAISDDLGSMTKPAALIHTVLLRLREAVPFAQASVWLVDGDHLHRLAAAGTEAESPGDGRSPTLPLQPLLDTGDGRGALHVTALEPQHPVRGLTGPNATSALLVPIDDRGRSAGVLVLSDPVVHEAHQVDLVVAVAQQLARVLENARLLYEARERSALEERQHLARELHDSVSQALFGVVLGLHTARKEIENRPRLTSAIDYASDLAEAALKEMRALIFELRPESLESEGLEGLLSRQADALRARHGLRVDLHVVEPPLTLSAKAALYRVAQEALHNVVKHAEASTVHVTLAHDDDVVRLVVRDDGHGFVADTRRAEAFGLRSMTERMTLLGGHLDVTSTPGAGTIVEATVAPGTPEASGRS